MNKQNKKTEYLNKFKDIKLSESSRNRIKNNLLEYARFHSVKPSSRKAETGFFLGIVGCLRDLGKTKLVRVGDESRFIKQVPQRTSLFNLFKSSKSMTAALIAIMLIAGGGTSYAAEGAVPGDFLYTMKTEVNENIKSVLAVSNESKAKLQARLAEERLQEAETLAARGELTTETSANISARVKAHYNVVEVRTSRAEAEGDYKLSATVRAALEGSFRTHADILSVLNTNVSGNNGVSLISAIRSYADASARDQNQGSATLETSESAKLATEATIKKADEALDGAEAKIAHSENRISADVIARVKVKLSDALAAQAEAKASFEAEAYRDAYRSALSAIRIVSQIETRIDSSLKLKVDLGTRANIESVLDIKIDEEEAERGSSQSDGMKKDENTPSDRGATNQNSIETRVNTDVIDVNVESGTSVDTRINL